MKDEKSGNVGMYVHTIFFIALNNFFFFFNNNVTSMILPLHHSITTHETSKYFLTVIFLKVYS